MEFITGASQFWPLKAELPLSLLSQFEPIYNEERGLFKCRLHIVSMQESYVTPSTTC
jgi:hypothetical protein